MSRSLSITVLQLIPATLPLPLTAPDEALEDIRSRKFEIVLYVIAMKSTGNSALSPLPAKFANMGRPTAGRVISNFTIVLVTTLTNTNAATQLCGRPKSYTGSIVVKKTQINATQSYVLPERTSGKRTLTVKEVII